MAVRQVALVSDKSALEACLRRCAIQIDNLYLFTFYLDPVWPYKIHLMTVDKTELCDGLRYSLVHHPLLQNCFSDELSYAKRCDT